MIYTIISSMNEQQPLVSKTTGLPTTVMDMASSDQNQLSDTPITVLDLSNPKDLALVTEAGYSMLDLSSSGMTSYAGSEAGSSDTVSLAGTDDFSDLDPDIAKAAAKAAQTGSLTPLIKEELKCNIKRKRLEKGKESIIVDLTMKKRPKEELTPEEEERRKRRRERNKIAAQKCRNKRRVQSDTLEEESTALEEANDDLKKQIEQLENEKEMLRNMLRTHDMCPRSCNTRLSTCSEGSEAGSSHKLSGSSDRIDSQDLGVQMELEITDTAPESPFSVELIGAQVDLEEDACISEVFLK